MSMFWTDPVPFPTAASGALSVGTKTPACLPFEREGQWAKLDWPNPACWLFVSLPCHCVAPSYQPISANLGTIHPIPKPSANIFGKTYRLTAFFKCNWLEFCKLQTLPWKNGKLVEIVPSMSIAQRSSLGWASTLKKKPKSHW